MVLSQKTINIIMDPTKKSLAFSGIVTQQDNIILRSNGWVPNGEPKVLKSGRILHLWERSKTSASPGALSEPQGVSDMETIASALGGIEEEISETDFQNKLDDINEQIGRMGGGRRKSRKQKKSKKYRKSKKSKKSRKSTKRRR
jgi:hypothetical protein